MAYHGGMSERAETMGATPPPAMRIAPATEAAPIAQAPPRETSAEREFVIPVRKSDIIDALIEHGSLESAAEHDQFRQFCKVLGAIYHYEHFEELERMREDYHYFSPDLDPHAHFDHATLEHAYADLSETLTAVLKEANFIELTHEEIELAHKEHPTMRVNVKVALQDFREVRFFRRGHHHRVFEVAQWRGYFKRKVETEVYDDVVMFAALKTESELTSPEEIERLRRHKIRPGSVLIKYFRKVARADLKTLFPNAQVVMGNIDKVTMGIPALLGGVPILLKLISTITVVFAVAGFYLGITSVIEEDEMKAAFAALTLLLAFGGMVVRQFARYQRKSLRYHKVLHDNVYYRNVNNNSGIFDYLIHKAETQDFKEAFLAYYFLLAAKEALTEDELERRVEAWLKEKFGVEVTFEVDDAHARLVHLGLLQRDGEKLSARPLGDALWQLDHLWASFFTAKPARVGSGP
jgi:Protein of unknown function (DUF3754)